MSCIPHLLTISRGISGGNPSRFSRLLSGFALLAATAVSGYAQPVLCDPSAGVPPVVRAEGVSELVGDFVLQCRGGTAGEQQTATFTLFLNTQVTSRSANGTDSEALLLVDDLQGATPAGYKGTVQNNAITWSNVAFTAPGANNTRTFRFTNVRANAAGIPASGSLVPSQIFAFLSVGNSGVIALSNPQQAVAFVVPGLSFGLGACGGTGALLDGDGTIGCSGANNSGNRNLVTGTAGDMQYSLRFKELIQPAFRRQIADDQGSSVPGSVYSSESGFVRTSLYPYEVGLTNHGTRLHARFTNVPTGVRVFVTNTQSLGTSAGSAAVLVQVNGAYVTESLVPRTPTALTSTHTLYCPEAAQTGFGAVEVPITNGSGEAVWEVTSSNSVALDTITFGVALAHSGSPTNGRTSIEGFFGPRYAANNGLTLNLPTPRFAEMAAGKFARIGAVAVSPTILPAGTTLNLTVQAGDSSCIAGVNGISFDRSGVTSGQVTSINNSTWTIPLTIAPNTALGDIIATLASPSAMASVPMAVGPTGHSLSGVVRWRRAGETVVGTPLQGVTVTLSGGATGSTTTDSSGNYSFIGLTAGQNYSISFSRSGFTFSPAQIFYPGLQHDASENIIANPIEPVAPTTPNPANGGSSGLNPTLSWADQTTGSPMSYDVYFGTSPTPPLAGTTTSPNFNPGTLQAGVTYYWRVVASNPYSSANSATWSFVPTATAPGYNIFWQDPVSMNVAAWQMSATGNFVGWDWVSQARQWRLAGMADFNGDGKRDIVWQDPDSMNVAVWYMGGANGTTFLGWNWISQARQWPVVGVADLNLDGKPDIVWQDPDSMNVAVWYLGGSGGNAFLGWNWISQNRQWRVAGLADLNRDGRQDIVWQDPVSMNVAVWYLGGTGGNNFVSWNWISQARQWQLVGLADLNGDGMTDIAWQDPDSKNVAAWFMGGSGGVSFLGWNWISTARQWDLVALAPR